MFNRSKPTETTDTVLEKLKRSPLENIVVRIGEARYLVPTATVKILAWNAIPDSIKDETSEAARKFATARTGIKALIRPMLPEILRKTWGQEVEITPRLNILSWLPAYLLHFLINVIASKEWIIHVEECNGCEKSTYKVVGLSPNADTIHSPAQIPASRADNEPLSGREEPDALGTADHNIIGGSVGHRRDDRIG